MTCRCGLPIPAGGHWQFHVCKCGLVTERGYVEARPAVGRAPEENAPSPYLRRLMESIRWRLETP